jgi:hypothetical protein
MEMIVMPTPGRVPTMRQLHSPAYHARQRSLQYDGRHRPSEPGLLRRLWTALTSRKSRQGAQPATAELFGPTFAVPDLRAALVVSVLRRPAGSHRAPSATRRVLRTAMRLAGRQSAPARSTERRRGAHRLSHFTRDQVALAARNTYVLGSLKRLAAYENTLAFGESGFIGSLKAARQADRGVYA